MQEEAKQQVGYEADASGIKPKKKSRFGPQVQLNNINQ